jgi:hypothetical protein
MSDRCTTLRVQDEIFPPRKILRSYTPIRGVREYYTISVRRVQTGGMAFDTDLPLHGAFSIMR